MNSNPYFEKTNRMYRAKRNHVDFNPYGKKQRTNRTETLISNPTPLSREGVEAGFHPNL